MIIDPWLSHGMVAMINDSVQLKIRTDPYGLRMVAANGCRE
jgi:hypothetical protein